MSKQEIGLCEADLAEYVETAKNYREKASGSGVFVVIEGHTNVATPKLRARWDQKSYSGCLDDIRNNELTKLFRPFVLAVLAALGLQLSQNASCNVTKIGEVMFLVDESTENPIYAVDPLAIRDSNITLSSPFTRESFEKVGEHVPKILKYDNLNMSFKLLASSFDKSHDELESYIFAWSALESFIKISYSETSSGEPSASVESCKPDLSKRPRISKAFENIVKTHNQNNSDVKHFKSLNKIRNDCFHEAKIPDILPTKSVQKLLIKYLNLHLNSV